jgi:hypothetical protein
MESTCAARSAARLERYEDAPKSVQFPLSQSLVKWGIRYGACIMAEKVERPKKKTTANPGKLETEGMPSVTPRKRRAGRTADRAPSAHEVGRHAEPTPRGGQGHRSDRKPRCPCQPHFSEKDYGSCAYSVNRPGAPAPKTSTDVARASSDVYGHAPSPQVQHVQSWFTTSQNQTGH